MKLQAMAALAAFLLAACSAPTVPDFTWYRLPAPQVPERGGRSPLPGALVVESFGADGLYADQALVYAVDAGARQLRQYHYQLWIDPPTRLLQRRLILALREAGVAAQVTDELPASAGAIRVRGTLLRFDRVPTAGDGCMVVVALKLRADGADGRPLLDEYYRDEQPAQGGGLDATVAAYGVALDRLFAQFQRDLLQRGGSAHAP